MNSFQGSPSRQRSHHFHVRSSLALLCCLLGVSDAGDVVLRVAIGEGKGSHRVLFLSSGFRRFVGSFQIFLVWLLWKTKTMPSRRSFWCLNSLYQLSFSGSIISFFLDNFFKFLKFFLKRRLRRHKPPVLSSSRPNKGPQTVISQRHMSTQILAMFTKAAKISGFAPSPRRGSAKTFRGRGRCRTAKADVTFFAPNFRKY